MPPNFKNAANQAIPALATLGAPSVAKAGRDDEVYLVYVDFEHCYSCRECVEMRPVHVFEMAHSAEAHRCLQCNLEIRLAPAMHQAEK